MAFFYSNRDCDLIYENDDYISYLVASNLRQARRRSLETQFKRLHVRWRSALRSIDALLHRSIEAMAAGKTRRLQTELAFRGVRYPANAAPTSDAGRSEHLEQKP